MRPSPKIPDNPPLCGGSAVAIIRHVSGKFLMQLRDESPDISFAGMWGLFGGELKGDEAPLETLRRELLEELNFSPADLTYFTSIDYDLTPRGQERKFRAYFETTLGDDEYEALVLTEGAGMALFPISELLGNERLIPFDEYALRLYTDMIFVSQNSLR